MPAPIASRQPLSLGGTRIAHVVVKPAIVGFFDASMDGTELQLDRTSVGRESPLVHQTLEDVDVRGRWGLDIVAVQRRQQVLRSPSPDFTVEAGDVPVVFG